MRKSDYLVGVVAGGVVPAGHAAFSLASMLADSPVSWVEVSFE
jgi:hypothetical protein